MKTSAKIALVCCAMIGGVCSPLFGDVTMQIGPLDETGVVQIRSRDIRQQLFVTYTAGNSASDVTRTVQFTIAPEGIVQIDGTGLVTPIADGEATITARQGEY